jgi:cholesterol oxidase
LDADVASLFGSSTLSAGLMPLIGVGRDVPTGELGLDGGRLTLSWRRSDSEMYYRRALGAARDVTEALNGSYWDTTSGGLDATVTMPPLGGCPMGRTPREGVVDSFGEVFNYPGLFVADGSVMPGPVGVNPSLTIAAIADRTADRMLGMTAEHALDAQGGA